MKARVDKDLCIGCGNCAAICPMVFRMDSDDKAEAIEGKLPEELVECAKEAERNCPVDVITVEK